MSIILDKVRYSLVLGFCLMWMVMSCNSIGLLSANKSSPHQQYQEGLKKAGLDQTQLGNQWIRAATRSLSNPLLITIPYKESGYFAPEKPEAEGYIFEVLEGEVINIDVRTVPVSSVIIFSDLWHFDNGKNNFIATGDTLTGKIIYTIKKSGKYIARLQPELLQGVEYTITITTSPSLGFPVKESGKPRIISFWGAGRDKGKRSHEGIDIGASFRTPAVAVSNGYISNVTENNLGGKVVFLRPHGKNYSVYYAHLDTQMVKQGNEVKAGDVIGLVGNTGNAKYTPPHLHLGIYTNKGAVDPLPFINNNRKPPKEIAASSDNLNNWMRMDRSTYLFNSPDGKNKTVQIKKGNVARVAGVTENWYKIVFPDDTKGYIKSNDITAKFPGKTILEKSYELLDQPYNDAPMIMRLDKGNQIEIIGTFNDYTLITYNGQNGWIQF